jgi:hypothetical protein
MKGFIFLLILYVFINSFTLYLISGYSSKLTLTHEQNKNDKENPQLVTRPGGKGHISTQRALKKAIDKSKVY